MFGSMWGKLLYVFLLSILFPKVSYFLIHKEQFNILQTLVSVGGAGVVGSFLFTFLFDGAINYYDRLMDKYFPSRKKNKRIFSRKTRFIIKAKKSFGILGIAAIAPWISIPLASFLGVRFFSDRKRVFMWLSISCIIWAVIMHYLLLPMQTLWREAMG